MWMRKMILLSTCLFRVPGWTADVERSTPDPIENSLGMKFVLIPAGEFMMGRDETPEALARAYPQYDPKRFLELGTVACGGGSWHTWAFYARSSYRNWNAPDPRYTLVGMRLLREVELDGR